MGLAHDHIMGFLPQLASHKDVELVGIVESNPELVSKYESRFHLDPKLFYSKLEAMMQQTASGRYPGLYVDCRTSGPD